MKGKFSEVLRKPQNGDIAIIAEVKRASPSAGEIKSIASPIEQAQKYEKGRADAISVLTDAKFFHGSLDDLRQVVRAVSIPVLRKDFVIDEYQIYEAVAAGASAILLIAAILSAKQIQNFLDLASKLSLSCLVEIHNEKELEKVLATSADIIGINARDLKTFKVDLQTIVDLAPKIPQGKITVAESGIFNREDIEKVKKAGCHVALIGTALMKSDDPISKIKQLKGITS